MNMLYLRYALEVARTGSMSKAAENLYVAQPNLSRAVKELESALNIVIFERKNNGVAVTAEGKRFLQQGRKIVREIDELETVFGKGQSKRKVFTASGPHAGYLAEAIAAVSGQIDRNAGFEIFYREAGSVEVIDSLLHTGCQLGIIRYAFGQDARWKALLEEKGLNHELIAEFEPVVLVSRQSPLAKRKQILPANLRSYIEVTSPDSPLSGAQQETECMDLQEHSLRRVCISDRAGRLEVLSANPECFLWGFSEPEGLLSRYGLVMCPCEAGKERVKDVLVYRKDYSLGEADKIFITALCQARRRLPV